MRERIMSTSTHHDNDGGRIVKEESEFLPSVIATKDLNLVFNSCSYEEQVKLKAYQIW